MSNYDDPDALLWQTKEGWQPGDLKTIRSEEVFIGPQSGSLDIRGNDFEAALLLNKKIFAFHWSDCGGSVGQHLVRRVSRNNHEALQGMCKSVEKPITPNETLEEHFSEVLSLLASGHYLLALEEIPADSYVVEFLSTEGGNLEATNFYPGFGAMLATQPSSKLSSTIVDRFSEKIARGARPFVVTISAEDAWCEFIIDGHHKIPAYRRTNVPILRLNIIRRNSKRLPLIDLLEFVPNTGGFRKSLVVNRRV